MKKALFAMVLAMVVAASAQAVSIALVPGALTVTPSTTFVLDVVITGADSPVEVVDVVVYFNPALVTGVGASEGAWMNTGGPLLAFEEVDNVGGSLSYTIARLGPNGSTGSGTAASLTFHCEGAGVAALSYYAAAMDVDANILAELQDTVTVQQGDGGGVVPEPMTLALVGVALSALGLVARKRS